MRPALLPPASRERESEMNQRTMDTVRALTAAAAAANQPNLNLTGSVNLHAKDAASHADAMDALTCILGEPDQHEQGALRWAAWEPGEATICLFPPLTTSGSVADHAAGLVTEPAKYAHPDEMWGDRS